MNIKEAYRLRFLCPAPGCTEYSGWSKMPSHITSAHHWRHNEIAAWLATLTREQVERMRPVATERRSPRGKRVSPPSPKPKSPTAQHVRRNDAFTLGRLLGVKLKP